MRKIFVALALLMFASVAPAETLRAELNDGIIMEVSDAPCKNGKVLALVEQAYAAAKKAPPPLAEGWASFPGQGKRHGCWALNGALEVVLIYEDGTGGIVSLSAFAPKPEVKI